MFEVSLAVGLALLRQCNGTTPAQQFDGASLLYYLGSATMKRFHDARNNLNKL
jgi:hypothetical protein